MTPERLEEIKKEVKRHKEGTTDICELARELCREVERRGELVKSAFCEGNSNGDTEFDEMRWNKSVAKVNLERSTP